MRLEHFDYELPPERIAQTPIEPRDASRLLVLRADGRREHRRFPDLTEYLSAGDLLVFNDTRVLPARFNGRKETGAAVEILLLRRLQGDRWEALAHPGRRLQPGARIAFGEGELTAEVLARGQDGTRILRFYAPRGPAEVDAILHRLGQVPLPPYIRRRLEDPERYQTLYAREEGSAAAPTAGLHFTPRVLDALREKGVRFAYVTLHVGEREVLHRMSLSDLDARLDPRRFVRIHRSAIVNLERVQRLEPLTHGEFDVVVRGGARVRLSRTYRAHFESRLKQSL